MKTYSDRLLVYAFSMSCKLLKSRFRPCSHQYIPGLNFSVLTEDVLLLSGVVLSLPFILLVLYIGLVKHRADKLVHKYFTLHLFAVHLMLAIARTVYLFLSYAPRFHMYVPTWLHFYYVKYCTPWEFDEANPMIRDPTRIRSVRLKFRCFDSISTKITTIRSVKFFQWVFFFYRSVPVMTDYYIVSNYINRFYIPHIFTLIMSVTLFSMASGYLLPFFYLRWMTSAKKWHLYMVICHLAALFATFPQGLS